MTAPEPSQRLLSLHTSLLACDQAIIRATSSTTMFEDVCRCLVSPSGMQLAWIGLLDHGDQRIWPQAHAGEDWSDRDWIRLSTNLDQLPGQIHARTAIQQNLPVWSNGVDNAPLEPGLLPPTHSKHWRSAATLPLCQAGEPCGVLCVYDQTSDAFDAPVRVLLTQLASNISAALDNLQRSEQRQQAEYALQESEARYNALFASNCMPMLVIDPTDGRILDANILAMHFYGWDHATMRSKCVMDINTQSPEELRAEMASAVANKRAYFDASHRLANGEVRDVEVFSSPLSFNGQTCLVTAIHDVTGRKRLQAQVRQQQSLMQRFIDELPGTAFVKDSNLRLLMANQQLGRVLGRPADSLIGKTAHDIFPGEFADFVTLLDREVLDAGSSRTFEETFLDRHNETSMFVIDDGSGQRYLGGLSIDVTDRYRAKERTNALLRINALGGQLSENELLCTDLKLAMELTHSNAGWLHFVAEDQRTLELVTCSCTPTFGSGEQRGTGSKTDVWADSLHARATVIDNTSATRRASVLVTENGAVCMLLSVAGKHTDYADFDTEGLQLLGNDLWRIARRARLEASLTQRVADLVEANRKLADIQLQLLQSEKMASIGQLASGVAHEINNPIGFVKSNLNTLAGYVENLLGIVRAYEAVEDLHGDAVGPALEAIAKRKQDMDYAFVVDDVQKLLDESNEGVQRVSQIVLDLKNFSRSGDQSMAPADLQQGIESTINVVWNQLKYKVEVVREYAALPPVVCVASQINQVVMNLLTNAEQAIEGHGTITLRTGQAGESVWLEVQDTGCGMTPAQQARIFEPFYTSKPVGQGTGLGLSVSFGIVQRHGGSISVQSTPGVGSTFRVTLPLQPQESPA